MAKETARINNQKKGAEKVTEGEYEVFDLIARNGEITQNEIATQLNVSRATVYMRIKPLKRNWLLLRLDSDTKRSWKVTGGV
jgi:DNA-binding MarR family transcriptional regulator